MKEWEIRPVKEVIERGMQNMARNNIKIVDQDNRQHVSATSRLRYPIYNKECGINFLVCHRPSDRLHQHITSTEFSNVEDTLETSLEHPIEREYDHDDYGCSVLDLLVLDGDI